MARRLTVEDLPRVGITHKQLKDRVIELLTRQYEKIDDSKIFDEYTPELINKIMVSKSHNPLKLSNDQKGAIMRALNDKRLDAFFMTTNPLDYAVHWFGRDGERVLRETLARNIIPENEAYFSVNVWPAYYSERSITLTNYKRSKLKYVLIMEAETKNQPNFSLVERKIVNSGYLEKYLEINRQYLINQVQQIINQFKHKRLVITCAFNILHDGEMEIYRNCQTIHDRRVIQDSEKITMNLANIISDNLAFEVDRSPEIGTEYGRVQYSSDYEALINTIYTKGAFNRITEVYEYVALDNGFSSPDNTCFYDCIEILMKTDLAQYKHADGVHVGDINKVLKQVGYFNLVQSLTVVDENFKELYYKESGYKNAVDPSSGVPIPLGKKLIKPTKAILYKNNHFSLIPLKTLVQKSKKRTICIFDFETVYKAFDDEKTPLLFGPQEKHKNKSRYTQNLPFSLFAVYYNYDDIINGNFKPLAESYFDTRVSADPPDSSGSNNICINFLKDLQAKYATYGHITCTGWNISGFDMHLLISTMLDTSKWTSDFNISKHSIFAGNSILKLVTEICTFVDMYKIIPQSLSDVCDGYKIRMAKLADKPTFKQINDHYNGIALLSAEQLDKFKEYNKYDCYAVAEIISKFVKNCTDATKDPNFKDMFLSKFFTIAGISKHYACELCPELDQAYKLAKGIHLPKQDKNDKNEEQIIIRQFETLDMYKFVRMAIYAGRVSPLYNKPIELRNEYLCMLDVCSMYPTQMRNKKMPIGKYIETPTYVPGKMGIYNVKILSQAHLTYKIIPRRTEGESLNYNFDGEFECVLNTVDIEQLQRHNVPIEIYSGIYWEKTTKELFKNYIDTFMKIKSEQDTLKNKKADNYNPALREIAKLFLNNMSGAVAMNLHNDVIEILYQNSKSSLLYQVSGVHKADHYVINWGAKPDEVEDIKTPSHIAGFIYSYSRATLYEALQYGALTCDTDSVILKIDDFIKFATDNPEKLALPTDLTKVYKIPEKLGYLDKAAELKKAVENINFKADFNADKALGSWEIEKLGYYDFYCIGKKIYGFFDPIDVESYYHIKYGTTPYDHDIATDFNNLLARDKNNKYRLKGVSKKSAQYSDGTIMENNPRRYFIQRLNGPVEFSTFTFMKCIKTVIRNNTKFNSVLLYGELIKQS